MGQLPAPRTTHHALPSPPLPPFLDTLYLGWAMLTAKTFQLQIPQIIFEHRFCWQRGGAGRDIFFVCVILCKFMLPKNLVFFVVFYFMEAGI